MPKVFRNDPGRPILPVIGKIVKGRKDENGKPVDLPYFVFKGKTPQIQQEFVSLYGEQPQELEIGLPYATTRECVDVWNEEWGASLKTRCDGVHRVDPSSKAPIGACLQNCRCVPIARMPVILRRLGRLAVAVVETRSVYDIHRLRNSLSAIEKYGGILSKIPFVLRRTEETISRPVAGGRQRRTAFLLSIEVDPAYAAAMVSRLEVSPIGGVLDLEALPEAPPEEIAPIEIDDALEEPATPAPVPVRERMLAIAKAVGGDSRSCKQAIEFRYPDRAAADLTEGELAMALDILLVQAAGGNFAETMAKLQQIKNEKGFQWGAPLEEEIAFAESWTSR